MKTTEFLDAIRARHHLTSDYQLAKFLGYRQATISRYRTGGSMMDEAMCLKVAEVLELDPGHVLAAIAAERAKPEEVKTAWSRVARQLAKVGCVALVALAGGLHNQNGRAAELTPAAGTFYTYATKRRPGLTRWAVAAFSHLVRYLGAALALCALAAGTAQAAEWSTGDTWREVAYQGLLAVDCSQTWRGSVEHPGQFEETNPVMGSHPSKGRVIGVCVASSAGHYLISRALPDGWRDAWQGVTIFAEAYAVDNNWNNGLSPAPVAVMLWVRVSL